VLWSERSSNVAITAIIAAWILIEGAAIPLEMNRTWNQNEAVPPAFMR
jgi:hypothetical protein